jgi:hypothetical protein
MMEFEYGTVYVGNVEEVGRAILEVLRGKPYTFVAANEYFGFKPKVRTGQRLREEGDGSPLSVHRDEDNDPPRYAGFNFCDTYGVWGISTSQQEPGYDPEFNAPYVRIEHGHTVSITQRAAAGHLIHWVAAVEKEA